jgi:hypothetical protein
VKISKPLRSANAGRAGLPARSKPALTIPTIGIENSLYRMRKTEVRGFFLWDVQGEESDGTKKQPACTANCNAISIPKAAPRRRAIIDRLSPSTNNGDGERPEFSRDLKKKLFSPLLPLCCGRAGGDGAVAGVAPRRTAVRSGRALSALGDFYL